MPDQKKKSPTVREEQPLTVDGVLALAKQFSGIDMTGTSPPAPPWGKSPSVDAFAAALDSGTAAFPPTYCKAYVEPLRAALSRLVYLTQKTGSGNIAESLLGAVYDHDPANGVDVQLHRFQAVVMDLYDSFLSKEKRRNLNLPLLEKLPPLPTFKNQGDAGPFTLPADIVKSLIDATVGVVSLPSTYKSHPALWGALAHETGGHDVVHADPGLLEEFKAGVQPIFTQWAAHVPATSSTLQQEIALLGPLWAYWMDEAAADAYGVLNLGPVFPLTFVAFLSALRAAYRQGTFPEVMTSTVSGFAALDPHPTDILRPFLAMGVISSLGSLHPAVRAFYLKLTQELTTAVGGNAPEIEISGKMPLTSGGRPQRVTLILPMDVMTSAAFKVGEFLVTTPFNSLGGRSIQAIETWDDDDETVVQQIAADLENGQPIAHGDAAQALAGATLAMIAHPDRYGQFTEELDKALDERFDHEPTWGLARVRAAMS